MIQQKKAPLKLADMDPIHLILNQLLTKTWKGRVIQNRSAVEGLSTARNSLQRTWLLDFLDGAIDDKYQFIA